MQIDNGATIAGLDIRMRPVLIAADRIWKKYGNELVVTCGLNGVHSAGSLHYYGLALDFRTRYFTATEKTAVEREMAADLGDDFDVVMHNTHMHVEYDPK
jgi:hypothetical protein